MWYKCMAAGLAYDIDCKMTQYTCTCTGSVQKYTTTQLKEVLHDHELHMQCGAFLQGT